MSETPYPDGLSVVIPVYNSAGSLPPLLEQLAAALPDLRETYEVILVNDGSRDASWTVVEGLAEQYDFVRGVNLMRNYGQHNALLCGIRLAQYAIILTMDDDLQHPPAEISKLLTSLEEGGHDVVYGVPANEQHNLWRVLASQITKWVLQAAMGEDVARNISAFRAFRTEVRRAFVHYDGPFVNIDVLLTWGTTNFAAVPTHHDKRTIGQSNYTFRSLIRHSFNMITGFSTLPLQFASMMGFAFTLFGVFVLVYVVGRALLAGIVVQGFAFTASIIALFSGVQLLTIGIIGEYLARMYARNMGRPTSVIRTKRGFHPVKDDATESDQS